MKAINEGLVKLNKHYQQMISDYAVKVFNEKVIPVCLENGLSYCTMNCTFILSRILIRLTRIFQN